MEAVLTRINSSDEEPLVRPTTGRHVTRKVREEQSRFLVPADEPAASSAHRVAIPCHHELPSEVDVAAPRVPFLSNHGRRGPGALVVDMTEADSDEDEDCESDGRSDFVFAPVDTDDEDENVVDALQQDLDHQCCQR